MGIISAQTESKKFCHQDTLDTINAKWSHKNCSSNLKHEELKKRLIDQCTTKNFCQITTHNLVKEKVPPHDECGDESYLFIQAPCKYDIGKEADRRIIGLYISCIAVFIYFFMLVFMDYVRCKQDTLYIDWDVKTVTAGDYTVEFEVSIEIYQKFLQKFYDETNPISENNQFKLYIKDEFERRLDLFPDLGLD